MADLSLGIGTYAAVFAPLEAAGRAEAITRRLSDAISLGVLPDGLLLPSETDLADQLGVATVTVREALGSLRTAGLIRTRAADAVGRSSAPPPTADAPRCSTGCAAWVRASCATSATTTRPSAAPAPCSPPSGPTPPTWRG